jgi:CheY-like chemotaxis protein
MEGELSDEQQEQMEIVLRSARHLLGIINDILHYSKLEAGQVVLEEGTVELREVVDDVLDLMAVQAEEKGLELAAHVRPGAPARVRGDAGRIRQILTNLVGNAVKFTSSGHVLVELSSPDGADEVVLDVVDTGIGIEPHRLEAMFDKFTQADEATNRRFGGTGLGLAISRRLARLMDGDVSARSRPGEGSTFTFRALLPPEAGEEPEPPLDGEPVLVAAASPETRRSVAGTVRELGGDVWADGALEALPAALVRAARQGRPAHAVLLDGGLGLPRVRETLREIREAGVEPPPRIGVLLYPGQRGHDPGLMDAGVDRCILKPLRRARLLRFLEDGPAQARGDAGPAHARRSPAERHPTVASLRVLLVEDDPVNVTVTRLQLERMGCEVSVADNGEEAVATAGVDAFDVILMDCHMPVMDGFDATRAIRAGAGPNRETTILALTASVLEADRRRIAEAGADAFLSKPIEMDALGEALAEWADREEAESMDDPAQGEADPGLPVFRSREALAMAVDDPSVLAELVRLLVEQWEGLARQLEEGRAAADGAALREVAHRLKGTAGCLAAPRLQELARGCEERWAGNELGDVDERIERLAHEVETLVADIHRFLEEESA